MLLGMPKKVSKKAAKKAIKNEPVVTASDQNFNNKASASYEAKDIYVLEEAVTTGSFLIAFLAAFLLTFLGI